MSVKTPTLVDTVPAGLQQTTWSTGKKLCSPDSDNQLGASVGGGGAGGRVRECSHLPSWLLGKSEPELSWDGCQHRAEVGVADLPGCRKEGRAAGEQASAPSVW